MDQLPNVIECPNCGCSWDRIKEQYCVKCVQRFHARTYPTKMRKVERIRELENMRDTWNASSIPNDYRQQRMNELLGRNVDITYENWASLLDEVQKQDEHPWVKNKPQAVPTRVPVAGPGIPRQQASGGYTTPTRPAQPTTRPSAASGSSSSSSTGGTQTSFGGFLDDDDDDDDNTPVLPPATSSSGSSHSGGGGFLDDNDDKDVPF